MFNIKMRRLLPWDPKAGPPLMLSLPSQCQGRADSLCALCF